MKKKQKEKTNNVIQNCIFTGVRFDHESLQTLLVTAEALRNITRLYSDIQVKIDSMLKIEDGEITSIQKSKGEKNGK